jgi:polysaccharide deacetylase 2 family uncharacterized protein YibQ
MLDHIMIIIMAKNHFHRFILYTPMQASEHISRNNGTMKAGMPKHIAIRKWLMYAPHEPQ